MLLFILLLLPLISCIIYYLFKHKQITGDSGYSILSSISIVIALLAVLGLVCGRIDNIKEVLKHKSIQQTITAERVDTISVFERATLTQEIIEQNKWLATEQYWANTYWLNWYYVPEMLKLKPIK